jgi:hypothetical protein
MEMSGQLHTLATLPWGKESFPGTPWTGGWVVPHSWSGQRRKISCTCQELNPPSSAIQTEACCYTALSQLNTNKGDCVHLSACMFQLQNGEWI